MVDVGTLSLILLGGMFVLLAIGMPLGFASAFLAVVALVLKFGPDLMFMDFGRGPFSVLSQAVYRQMTNYVLISVPLFIFMAALLERSGIARDMYSSLNVWLNRTRGGIAIVTSIMAVIMAAMSGIIGGEVVLLGLIALPQMLRLGYNQKIKPVRIDGLHCYHMIITCAWRAAIAPFMHQNCGKGIAPLRHHFTS